MSSFNDNPKLGKANITFNKIKKKRRGNFVIFAIVCLFMASIGGAFTAVVVSNNVEGLKYFNSESKEVERIGNKNNKKLQDITSKTVKSVVSIINVINQGYHNKEVNVGVGVVLDSGGYIITGYDNISDASAIKVKSYSDIVYDAELIGFNSIYDIAMLKVKNSHLEPIKIADIPIDIKDGDEVISIGNPVGKFYDTSVEVGTIVNFKESVMFRHNESKVSELLKMIKTTIYPNYINTGAVLCNMSGELIGINSIAMTYHNDYLKNSFYINVEDLGEITKNILNSQDSMIDYIGVYGEVAVSQKKDGVEGVYAKEVTKNGLAYENGIRPTDIITKINGISVNSVSDINEILSELNADEEIKLKVYRGGVYREFSMKVPTTNK